MTININDLIGKNIPAITLWGPWATAIAIGLKHIETRHWRIDLRGNIAIHAAQRPMDATGMDLFDYYRDEFNRAGIGSSYEFPFGCIVAVAQIKACVETDFLISRISATEHRFGNYASGRFGWQFGDVLRLAKPIKAKGQQGLWRWMVPAGMTVSK